MPFIRRALGALFLFTAFPLWAEVSSTVHALGSALLGVRGGRAVDTSHPKHDAYLPVVALLRRYEKLNPKTGKWEEKESLCSGSVFNQVCVLTAEHCVAGEDERNISISVYSGNQLNKKHPVATGGKYLTANTPIVDFTPPAGLAREVANDIAVIRLEDGYFSEKESFFTHHLHNANTNVRMGGLGNFLPVQVVGYGSMNSNYDPKTKIWTRVGSGEKRDGDVELIGNIDGKSYLIETKPAPHSAAHGDSGGPLLEFANGELMIYGVVGSGDSALLTNVSSNYYTSVSNHLPWILSAFEKLDCTDRRAAKIELAELVHKQNQTYTDLAHVLMRDYPTKPDRPYFKKLFVEHLKKAVGFDSLENAKFFPHVRIRKAQQDPMTGSLKIEWEGAAELSEELERNILIRNPEYVKLPRPSGVIEIPSDSLTAKALPPPLDLIDIAPRSKKNQN